MANPLLDYSTEIRIGTMQEKMDRCGRGWTLYRRWWPEGGVEVTDTMAAMWACGLRACERCEGRAWAKARTRMLGEIDTVPPPGVEDLDHADIQPR